MVKGRGRDVFCRHDYGAAGLYTTRVCGDDDRIRFSA